MSNEIIIRPDEIFSVLGKGLFYLLVGFGTVLLIVLAILWLLGFWVGIAGLACVHERLFTQRAYTVGVIETIIYLIWGAITYGSTFILLGYFIVERIGL